MSTQSFFATLKSSPSCAAFLGSLLCGLTLVLPASGCAPGDATTDSHPPGQLRDALIVGPLVPGGSVVLSDSTDLASLHLEANQRLVLKAAQLNPPLTKRAFLQIRLVGYTQSRPHHASSAADVLYIYNGPAAQDIYVKIAASGPSYGFPCTLQARTTHCDDSCNENRTSFCDEATAVCGPCKASAYTGGTAACGEEYPICGSDGACTSCNGDSGSASTLNCPAAAPHCDPYGAGYGGGCRAYSSMLDFTPPPALQNRQTTVNMTCTWTGSPVAAAIQTQLVLGPAFLAATQSATDWRPQAYVHDILINGYSALMLDDNTSLRRAVLSWPDAEFFSLMNIVNDCGPSSTPDGTYSFRNYGPTTTPSNVFLADHCSYAVNGSQVDLLLEDAPFVCKGSAK
jgi:hypothetical protein